MSIGRNKPKTAVEAVTLQWANGKSQGRRAGQSRFSAYVGFHIEVGRDEELDRAMHSLACATVEIKHQRPGGAEIKTHWDLGEMVRLYPITSGPVAPTVAQSLAGPNARETAAAGLGLRWADGERSQLAVRGFIDLLGPEFLVQLGVKSRMTDELLKALIDHIRACEAADTLIDRTRHPELVTLHEVALPLGAGQEAEWGKGDTATVVPFVSLHPETIDADYLRSVWRPDVIHAAALREWEGIQVWAREYPTIGSEGTAQPARYEDEEGR
jgi:hypothetical protein